MSEPGEFRLFLVVQPFQWHHWGRPRDGLNSGSDFLAYENNPYRQMYSRVFFVWAFFGLTSSLKLRNSFFLHDTELISVQGIVKITVSISGASSSSSTSYPLRLHTWASPRIAQIQAMPRLEVAHLPPITLLVREPGKHANIFKNKKITGELTPLRTSFGITVGRLMLGLSYNLFQQLTHTRSKHHSFNIEVFGSRLSKIIT